MKQNKNLKFCLEILKSLRSQNESEPGQKRTLESASKRLRKLRRMANRDQEEIFRVVRQITEAIIKTLDHD
jgi:hypothetical protein